MTMEKIEDILRIVAIYQIIEWKIEILVQNRQIKRLKNYEI